MQIVQVDAKRIRSFVNFPDQLYKGDDKYVPYMKADQTKTLKKLLLKDKTYTALLCLDGKRIVGRVLLTVDKNKQLQTDKCGFFSMFECIDDQNACNAMMTEAVRLLKQQGAEYVSGTYFPHDQDNRRGILVEGFDRAPLIFTSYNKPYYATLLTNFGFAKQTDALQYNFDLASCEYDRIKRIANYSMRKFDFRVDTVDWNNVERDLKDVHSIMQQATTEIIYQDAPSIDALRAIVENWKTYLNKDFILIARDNKTNAPLGVAMALPDFFQVFRKMRGKMDLRGLIVFNSERKKIKSLRAMMQYVLPQYQNLGVAIAMYDKMGDAVKKYGINYVEAGTIMEDNVQSNESMKAVGGKLCRVYRIYYKQI